MSFVDGTSLRHFFVQGQGVLYAPRTILRIHTLDIPFPVEMTVRRRKKVIFHEVPGLEGTIKEILGEQDAHIQFRMALRDWDISPVSKITGQGRPVRSREILEDLIKIYKMDEPVEVVDTVMEEVSMITDAMESVGLVEVREPISLLDLLGISRVLFTSIEVQRGGGAIMPVLLTGISDRSDPALTPFLEEP